MRKEEEEEHWTIKATNHHCHHNEMTFTTSSNTTFKTTSTSENATTTTTSNTNIDTSTFHSTDYHHNNPTSFNHHEKKLKNESLKSNLSNPHHHHHQYQPIEKDSLHEHQQRHYPHQMKEDVIHQVLSNGHCLYARLGVSKYADSSTIRRAYLTRSKLCHPDRNKNHPLAKEAFQALSTAYKTLSCPSSRRSYDIYGYHVDANENTFSEAIAQVFHEFLDGQYDSLIGIIDYLQVLNPDIKINKDTARQVFSVMREYCLWGGKCWDAAKFEIIRLYEMQQDLRSLSYFNILGRLKLSVALSKTFLLIPFSFIHENSTVHTNSSIPSYSSPLSNYPMDPIFSTSTPSFHEQQFGMIQRILARMIFLLDKSERKLQNMETYPIFSLF